MAAKMTPLEFAKKYHEVDRHRLHDQVGSACRRERSQGDGFLRRARLAQRAYASAHFPAEGLIRNISSASDAPRWPCHI